MAAQRPGGVIAIGVVAIILGCLSSCAGVMACGGVAMQGQMEQMQQASMAGMPPNVQLDQMQAAQREMMEEQSKYQPITLGSAILGGLLALAILVAAAMALSGREIGRKLLVALFGAGMAFEVVRTGAEVWVQYQMKDIMDRYMSRVMTMSVQPGQPPMPQEFEGMMSGVMGAGVAIGMCLLVGWAAAKVVYYGISIGYLRKSEVRASFAQTETRTT